MPVKDLIRDLLNDPETRRRIAHIETIPPGEASYGTLDHPLPEPLEAFLARKTIRLYDHQACAVEALRSGEHIILTTPTASGKSLAFNLPVFERLLLNPHACALYLYPTKALANDQLKAVREMEGFTGATTASAIYDGDTPAHRRPGIRAASRIVLSNPYELHYLLPWHHKWNRFLKNLHFVVIDEAHRYRGVFGSHMAFLLRRLRRISALYGGKPQFILSTATIANPDEFAGRLTGEPVSVIDGDGSPRGERHFILYNPFFDGVERSTHQETRDLMVECIRHDLQTLCFTVSRKTAELITQWSREALARERALAERAIATYRAGYLPGTRRQIEERFKDGELRGVVSTNALEVGIDIGSLDAVIISGYPGTMMATWQQAGRAGRRSGSSVAALVGFQNPLDQYFMRHPGSFFARPHEHAIIDLANPYIIAGHLLCAAAEAPLGEEEARDFLGPDAAAMAGSLVSAGLLAPGGRGWVYAARGRAADAVSLGSISADSFRVVCKGELLETLDRAQAFREAHPGAVLLHQGETYIVEDFDPEGRRIRVRHEEVDWHTEALKHADTRILGELRRRELEGVTLSFGEVEVTERYYAYRVKRYDTVIETRALDLPETRFVTRAVWVTPGGGLTASLEAGGMDLAGGLHGCEHALIAMMPFHVLCDRWDIGGLSTPFFPETGGAMVMVYDGYEGGIGLAEKAFEIFGRIAATARDLVGGCGCSDGCPACIYSPKCGNDNRPLDKRATLVLLGELAGRAEDPTGGAP
jgi:DEAD/DEAH box helicase domain-containing protein